MPDTLLYGGGRRDSVSSLCRRPSFGLASILLLATFAAVVLAVLALAAWVLAGRLLCIFFSVVSSL